MQTTRRLAGLVLATTAVMLGLSVSMASAATETETAASHGAQTTQGPFTPVECKATPVLTNVSNFWFGYSFQGKCSPSHPLVVRVQWLDAWGNILGDSSGWIPKRAAGTWSSYTGNLQRPWSTAQTSYACIWVTQDFEAWLGGPVIASGCWNKNS
ncbi:MAG: hypothetical protein QOI48_2005 [Solirubrobacteraceae bacterium]|nr:hypothetical protein [Solirubrobacteraceae bacterium]